MNIYRIFFRKDAMDEIKKTLCVQFPNSLKLFANNALCNCVMNLENLSIDISISELAEINRELFNK